jgi:hypothetical protein
LKYAPSLARLIDNKIELNPGSQEELEIRRAAAQATEMIKQEFHSQGRKDIQAVHLDYFLRELMQKPEIKNSMKPHHRVKTTWY